MVRRHLAGELCGGSPGRMPSSAKWLCGIGVRSSGGDLKGTTTLTEGEVIRAFSNVASCWLIFDFRGEDGERLDLGPEELLSACVQMIRDAFLKHQQGPAVGGGAQGARQPHVSTSSAAGGCKTKRIAIAVKMRKGRVVSVKRAKNQKLRVSSVRYTCTGSGGAATLTVASSRPLSKVVGKRLNIRVVRSKKAPKRSARMSFAFGW